MAAPLRVHLASLARQGDPEAIEDLASIPALPPLAAHLWSYWLQLRSTKNPGPHGPARLERLEIRLWEGDEDLRLERWERRAILEIDGRWHRITSEALAKRHKPNPST